MNEAYISYAQAEALNQVFLPSGRVATQLTLF